MVNVLVFDYGGIIVNMDWNLLRDALSQAGISRLRMFFYRKKIKSLMNRYIDGIEPEEEVMKEMLAMCRPGTSETQVNYLISTLCGNIPASRLEMLVKLRKKYKVYLLSNINDTLWKECQKKMQDLGYTAEDCFDDVFLSYRMGVAKPDPKIFEMLQAATHLIPEETLYFDDNAANIATGKQLHYQSIHVKECCLEDYVDLIPDYQAIVKG
ncbi:MAG: HAD-IA family hydrolase [Paludibacteraceae bacterium]|nr:HAD-IA family hydrolase [Paludibacteraceae bacterium]